MDEKAVEQKSEENVEKGLKPPVEPAKKKKRRKSKSTGQQKKSPIGRPVEYEGEKYYGVELDAEGRLLLQDKYYSVLTIAEQEAELRARDLEIARLKEAGFRKEIESRLPPEVQREMANLAGKVQEANAKLAIARKKYVEESKAVQEETGLMLKKWLIDDNRRMRLIEKIKQE